MQNPEQYPLLVKENFYSLENYLNDPSLLSQNVDFLYALDVSQKQICYHRDLVTYMGYKIVETTIGQWINKMHPEERQKLLHLEAQLLDFTRLHRISSSDFGLSVVHQLRKQDGKYVKIMRRIYPFSPDQSGNWQVCYCLCTDITPHYPSDHMSIHVIAPSETKYIRKKAQQYFSEVLCDKGIPFTQRQIDVLKTWSETHSTKIAAERLNLRISTVETHLKNIRRRFGTHRSMEAVLYAKARGLF